MITDQNKNTLFFSELIRTDARFRDDFMRVEQILEKHHIKPRYLENTKDIWCRDYMPVQAETDKFVQFRFEPSYLNDYQELKTIPGIVLKKNNIDACFSPINLDGGNLVNCDVKAIVTDRIFRENPEWDKIELLAELEKTLGVNVYVIPALNKDLTGHADGHVRFIDNDTILVNSLENEYAYWKEGFKNMIEKSGLNYVEMPWFEPPRRKKPYSAHGVYINYLQLGNLIIFPIFETSQNKDEEAFDIVKQAFPNHIIEPVNINNIAEEGGLMNCISWSFKI